MHIVRQMSIRMSGRCNNSKSAQEDMDFEQQEMQAMHGMHDKMPNAMSGPSSTITF